MEYFYILSLSMFLRDLNLVNQAEKDCLGKYMGRYYSRSEYGE